jgi:hypothetical protein
VLLQLPLLVLVLVLMPWAWVVVTKAPSLALWRIGALVSLTGRADLVKLWSNM